MIVRAAIAFAGSILINTSLAGGTIVYVDDDAPRGGDGTSWETAFQFVQDALTVAGPVEIRIAEGTYQPDRDMSDPFGSGDREATFALANDTVLRGGYLGLSAGKGQDPDERSDVHETILTGDLAGNDEPGFVNYEDNSLHVISAMDVDETAQVDGVSITSGNADGAVQFGDIGGGVFIFGVISPRFDNCRFHENRASARGGALYGGAPFIRACSFFSNSSLRGGAIGGSAPLLED